MSSPRSENLSAMANGMERRAVRVVKKAEAKTPVEYRIEHEKAMLQLLVPEHPDFAKNLVEKVLGREKIICQK